MTNKKIAVVAGAMRLPFLVVNDLRAQGYEVFVIGLKNFCDEKLNPDMWLRLGALGTALKEIRRRNIRKVIITGALGHPKLSDIRPDFASIGILARVLKNQTGYDSMARALMAEIEKLGIEIIAAQKICKSLTFSEIGQQTKARPSKDDSADIKRGIAVSKAIGKMDIGQSVVVAKQVLAVEAAEGTAKMLERVQDMRNGYKKRSGVLVKLLKPGQDLRFDIPAIGPQTVIDTVKAKLNGIVVDAKNCWVIDKTDVLKLAAKHNIFIVAE